jgi:hypothetical protein
MDTKLHTEPQGQIQSLYQTLVSRQENVTEFRLLLAEYPPNCEEGTEPPAAIAVRQKLDQCVRDWTRQPFDGFTVAQIQMWRAIVIDRRIAIAVSSWNDSRS